MNKLRIATGGFAHETNTFSPLSTLYEDFHQEALSGTAQLEERLGDWQSYGVELIPALYSHALPGGLVERAAYLRLKEELLRAFERVLPLDGIHLDLHGAMEVEDIGDAEGDVALAVRELAGEHTLISVSLDLHGNISPTLVGNVNILTAYRTAPHRDSLDTRRRAMSLLVNSLKENKCPVSVLVKPPLLLAGEQAVPELLQQNVTAEQLAGELLPFLKTSKAIESCRNKLKRVREKLGTPGAGKRVANIAVELIAAREKEDAL